jgi:hypothetical protein
MTSRVKQAVEHRINFGDYEGVTLSVSVERDCDEGQEKKTLALLSALLARALEDDVAQARKLAPDDSYIHQWEL